MPRLELPPGVEGIAAVHELPDPGWEARWRRIVVAASIKERLLNYVLFSLRHRAGLDEVGLPVHGLVVLAGPPGTGKTTLAAGLADQAARSLEEGPLLFVEINPHVFPSQLLGESQRAVAGLFQRTLPDLARRGRPMVVLLDEVESLAVSRSGASLETNPVDVHRATDAVLEGVDTVATSCPNVTFVATTNYRQGVDEAFLSRADLVEEIALPGVEAVREILVDTMGEVGSVDGLEPELLDRVAKECVRASMDARQVRKLVLRAVCSRRELIMAPDRLRLGDVASLLDAGGSGSDGASRGRGS